MVAIASKAKADEKKSLRLKNIWVRVWVVGEQKGDCGAAAADAEGYILHPFSSGCVAQLQSDRKVNRSCGQVTRASLVSFTNAHWTGVESLRSSRLSISPDDKHSGASSRSPASEKHCPDGWYWYNYIRGRLQECQSAFSIRPG